MVLLKIKYRGSLFSKNGIQVPIHLERYTPIEDVHDIDRAFLQYGSEITEIQRVVESLPVKKTPRPKKKSVYFFKPQATCVFLHEIIGHPLEYFKEMQRLDASKNWTISDLNPNLRVSINHPSLTKKMYTFDDDGIEPKFSFLIHPNFGLRAMMNLATAFQVVKESKRDKTKALASPLESSLLGNSRSEFVEPPQVRQGYIVMEQGDVDLNEESENFNGISFYICNDGGYYPHLNKSFLALNGIFYKDGEPQFLINNFILEGNPSRFMKSIYAIGKNSMEYISGCGKNSSIIPVGVKAPWIQIIL